MDVKPVYRHSSVDVKDPAMSFAKSRRPISGTLNNLQIPALTGGEGTASPAQLHTLPVMLPRSLVLHTNEDDIRLVFLKLNVFEGKSSLGWSVRLCWLFSFEALWRASH